MTSERMKVVENVEKYWSNDKVIRYLYVKLAPFFQRDLDYFMGSEQEKIEMYKMGFKKNSHLVVCKTICEAYKDIYAEFGIESLVITTNKKVVPHYGLIVHGDYGWYYLDPLKDLFSNQLGLKSTFFGVTPVKYSTVKQEYPFLVDLPSAYIKQIDNELGLIVSGIYMDTFFDMLHLEITNNKVNEYFGIDKGDQLLLMKKKLEYIEKYLLNMGNIPGVYERNTFISFLIFYCFNKRERNFIDNEIVKNGVEYQIELKLRPKISTDEEMIFIEAKDNQKYYFKRKK